MKPFQVQWEHARVAHLLAAIEACQLPPAPEGIGWRAGVDAHFLAALQRYWIEQFDWQACIERLNKFTQYVAEIDGLPVHFVHVRGESEGRRPLLLTHGWPGSHFEFWNVIGPLAFPSQHGGKAEDAFDVVVPSLPGFGFSGKPKEVLGQRAVARLWDTLMTQVLGYSRYRAQGGDWGALVTSWLGLDHAASVEAIHLNMMGFRSLQPPQNDEEKAWATRCEGALRVHGGYSSVQMFKPQSLVWATAGNPLGQAAWLIERFHDWSDLRTRSFEQVFDKDTLLTNAMIYLMTDSFASAVWFYPGVVKDGFGVLPAGTRCETPTHFARYSGDALQPEPPRSRLELVYHLSGVSDVAQGGHFAALEVPELFVSDIRAWPNNYRTAA